MSVGKLNFEFKKENFHDFVEKMQDLSQISDTIKIKFDKDWILAYSIVANDVAVLCLKSYLLKTTEYFQNFKSDDAFDFVITQSSKFVKNIRFFEDFSKIKIDLNFKPSYENKDIMHIRAISLSTPATKGDRLRITLVGSELSKIRDLNKEILEARMNPRLSKWQFSLDTNDLTSIKKMSNINNEDKTISIQVSSNLVNFTEDGKWNLQVSECEYKDTKVTFNKKYLSNINLEKKSIDFQIFETFILISDDESKLLLSFETDFTDD